MGALRSFFIVEDGRTASIFLFVEETSMNKKIRDMVYAAIIAALYATLAHGQNLLLPGSATFAAERFSSASATFCGVSIPSANHLSSMPFA